MQQYPGRPEQLPDFESPPINEVVLGVQFEPIPGYHLAHLTEIWNLFRKRYSKVEYQPPLPPVFEAFGARPAQPGGVSFQFGPPFDHPRCWFISEDWHELIQFQPTRFLFNWRQVDGRGGEYPRYESVRGSFSKEFQELDKYCRSTFGSGLQVNQCEITYINRIYGASPKELPNAHEWLSFLRFDDKKIEGYGGGFTEVLRDESGAHARLFTSVNSAADNRGHPMIVVDLTVRGLPKGEGLDQTLEFMDQGRNIIVESFTKITTSYAHKRWGRVK
ncbi:TIGR04255 family protein [Nitratireductor sp. OM-1]|uniref:TIGR04255 family protein n=1 Tax=Nitratireductor sp. OM-1 TaxID=1756988 RepID=UPI000DE189E9|nr:TIGR04255 family protein [Nitratireductor sp. OM-1]